MASYYDPVAGTSGKLVIKGYEWPVSSWSWNASQNAFPLPTISAMPYMEFLPGIKTVSFSASGILRKTFNPFASPRTVSLGGTYDMAFYANNTIFSFCDRCYVTAWNWADDADGFLSFSISAVGQWKFKDFAGSDA